jgi:predicted nucleotidyltransferase
MSYETDIARIAEKHGLVLLVWFGSSVSGKMHVRSDIDLGVLSGRVPLPLADYAEILRDLQEIHPDREVDLAVLDGTDPLFLKKVMESCELLYGSPRRLLELRIYAFKRYQDHRRYLAMERQYVEKALEEFASR